MSRIRAYAMRLGGLFGFGRRNREIDEELATHRQMLEAEYLRSGMTQDAARRAAGAEFGSMTSAAEAYRDRRGVPALEGWVRDLRRAVRSLIRAPLLSLSMVLVLGLGIGLSTAVAAAFDAVIWRDLPVPEADRVVKITLDFRGVVSRQVLGSRHAFSYPEIAEYRRGARSMEGVAGLSRVGMTWRQDQDGGTRRLSAALVTSDFFSLLRAAPAIGRTLNDHDVHLPVVVISHRLWTEAFGGDSNVLTRRMTLDRVSYSIVGVANAAFTGTDTTPDDVWLPLEAVTAARGASDLLSDRNIGWLQVIGRLAPTASIPGALAESIVIAGRLDADYPGRRTTMQITRASRLDADLFQSRERGALIGVGGAGALSVAVLLLICGSNVAALFLARGAARRREVALRVALGAGRGQIARELIAEVLVVVGASAALAVAVYIWALRALGAWMPPQVSALLTTQPVDARVLGFVGLAAAGVACIFGLAPLRQTLRVDCLTGLTGQASVLGTNMPAVRLRQWIASGQIAVSVILLTAATLLGRGIERAFHVDPGYQTRSLYVIRPDFGLDRGAAAMTRRWQLMAAAQDALSGTSGVTAVSMTTIPPFSGTGTSSVRTAAMGRAVPVHFSTAGPDYFATLGLQPVAGRVFAAREPNVVLVNASLARRLWGDETAALNRQLEVPERNANEGPRLLTVIGVLPTVQTTDVGIPDQPTYYLPVTDDYLFDQAALIARTVDDASFPRRALAVLRRIDPDGSASVVSVDQRIAANTEPVRVATTLAALVGLLALLVSAVGIHGIIAHAVVSRTRDVALYLALGAPRGRVLQMVLGQTLRTVAIGGLAGASVMVGLMISFSGEVRAMLFGLAPLDPVAVLVATTAFVAVIGGAAYFPARRALGMDPAEALRQEH